MNKLRNVHGTYKNKANISYAQVLRDAIWSWI